MVSMKIYQKYASTTNKFIIYYNTMIIICKFKIYEFFYLYFLNNHRLPFVTTTRLPFWPLFPSKTGIHRVLTMFGTILGYDFVQFVTFCLITVQYTWSDRQFSIRSIIMGFFRIAFKRYGCVLKLVISFSYLNIYLI